MKVSDWHILPILETSLQFFSSSSGSVLGKKIFENELPWYWLWTSHQNSTRGTINKNKKSLIRGQSCKEKEMEQETDLNH